MRDHNPLQEVAKARTMSLENRGVKVTVAASEEMMNQGGARGRRGHGQSTKFTVCSRSSGQAPEYRSNRFTVAFWKW